MQKLSHTEVTVNALIRDAQNEFGNMHLTLALDAAELEHIIKTCQLARLKGLQNATQS